MAGEEAEVKKVAKLEFGVDLTQLDKINEKLKQTEILSDSINRKFANINFKKIDVSNMIDTTKVQSKLNTISGYTTKFKKDIDSLESLGKAGTKKYATTILTEETKIVGNRRRNQDDIVKANKMANLKIITSEATTADRIKVIDANTASYKEKRIADAALAQEKANLRVLNSTKTLSDKISEYAKTYIIYQGFNQLRQAITETIDEMVEIQYQMVQIERVLNDSSLDIDNYRDKLIQLAYDYGNTFSNVADITLRLAQAGFDADESLALSEKTLLALNTAELNATQATEDMVAVMAQWGLMTGTATEQAKSYGDIIDKINKVADNFPTTSEDILEALKKTSSAFNLAGASIDETIATIVAAETASQRGGRVIGTALSNIVQQLKAENKLDLAEQLGLDFFTDANKTEFRPIMEIFQEMSERMQSLKDQGKESSTEMQNLLELFTVFRRNVGASLLGEMAGEESTYAEALETSLNSVGYSLQENEKHMRTAKAAQAQFNAELLKLKTQVWDSGLEDVFRDMLSLGTGLVDGIEKLIDKFGLLPVTIAAVTLAFSLLNKNTQASNWIGLRGNIEKVNIELAKTTISAKGLNKALTGTNSSFQQYVKSIDKGKASMLGYAGYLTKTTAQTILLTAKTIILQMAISGGITLAITAIIGVIDAWINAEQKAIEKHTELMEKSRENAQTINEEKTSIEELRKEYEELARKDKRTTEDNQRIYEIQEKLNQLIKDTGTQVELVTTKINEQGKEVQVINDKYDEQLSKIKAIEYEKKRQEIEELRKTAEEARELLKGVTGSEVEGNLWQKFWDTSDLDKVKNKINEIGLSVLDLNENLATGMTFFGKPIVKSIEDLGFEEQLKFFTNARTELAKAEKEGKDVAKELDIVDNILKNMKDQSNQLTEAINQYRDALSDLYGMSGQIDTFNMFLDSISQSYDIKGPKQLIEDIEAINQQFADGKINIEEYFNQIEQKISEIDLSKEGEELEAYRAILAATTQSLAEGLESLQAGLESNTINFSEYSKGIKEAGDNALELFTRQNELTLNSNNQWVDANGNLNEYANNLQNAQNALSSFGDTLKVIGDNYDYISEHANASGEAVFKAADISSQSYQILATNLTNSLNQMKANNEAAFNAIVNDIVTDTGLMTNEILNANGYINEGLFQNSSALNSALNSSAQQTGKAVNNVTTAMGNVISALGDAISNFDYTLTGALVNSDTKEINVLGQKIRIPTNLKFKITGEGGSSIKGLSAALSDFGAQLSGLESPNFKYVPRTIGSYTPTITNSPISSSTPSYSGGSSSGGSSSGGSSSRDTSESDAQKAAEEAYKKRLSAFENYEKEKEKLEQRWVSKQKELGQLSTKDFLYITQQRIERYKKYLAEVKKATWMNEEDKLKLAKEYSEKVEDAQLDYIKYLEEQLQDDIKALQDANNKKIELIEEEADKRIEALKKVEHENDRIREKEEYQKKRQQHLEDISYWEQRTGREAQEALKEAKANLKELDEEWKQQLEDWSIADQIQAIEDERDAQIKAIEDAQQKQIDAWTKTYEARVKLFSETGKIVYDNTVIQSKNLYNAYKTNFVDPISKELANINKTTATKSTSSNKKEYETYRIKSGDTLSEIASKYKTTINKIMQANPQIKNRDLIYAGDTLKIPKFHRGGIVGGVTERICIIKTSEKSY